MDARLMFASGYFRAADFEGNREPTFTIVEAKREELTDLRNQTKLKGVLAFPPEQARKRWVMNRTNTLCLMAMFGNETANWVGKRVTLYREPFKDPQSKQDVGAIRVRGSPDIAADTSVLIELPRKQPTTRLLKKTDGKYVPGAQQAAPPQQGQQRQPQSSPPSNSGAIRAAGGITNSDMDRAGPPPVQNEPQGQFIG